MKKFIPYLAFFGLFSLFSANAQTYTPVVINAEVFFRTELETIDGVIASEVTVANFEKIDGQLYNRVFFKRGFGADELVGYLREDPGTSEIYFRSITDPTEWLVHDLRLEVDDVIELHARWCDGLNGDEAQVVEVNEVEGRRELVFDRLIGDSEFCEPLRFLEGVGPNATLIFPLLRDAIAENGTAQRICHASHDNVIFYPANTNVDLCGDAITDTNVLVEQFGRIFPNPAQNQIFLTDFPEATSVQVMNSHGQVLLKLQSPASIDCSNWPVGVYFFHLQSAGNQMVSKVVKI
ncbi:MAG: T9SS type A sorting domain-containing protein [Bacteroidota bacterium]